MKNAESTPTSEKTGWRRWVGPGALVAAGVLVLARFAVEPLRSVAHVDKDGMEAYGAMETYRIDADPTQPAVVFLGSSQTMWGIHAPTVAETLGLHEAQVTNLGSPGGTPFDMWNLVRRNPWKFEKAKVAVLEVSPFIMNQRLDDDDRLMTTISQRATLSERLLVEPTRERNRQLAEWALGTHSIRRSLASVIMNVSRPAPDSQVFPGIDRRTQLPRDWHPEKVNRESLRARHTVAPTVAAKRLMHQWQFSDLQEHALEELTQWFKERNIPIVTHQLPIHPEVAKIIVSDPKFHRTYKAFVGHVKPVLAAGAADYRLLSVAEIALGHEAMADRTHLNRIGATEYSRRLAEVIRKAVTALPEAAPPPAPVVPKI